MTGSSSAEARRKPARARSNRSSNGSGRRAARSGRSPARARARAAARAARVPNRSRLPTASTAGSDARDAVRFRVGSSHDVRSRRSPNVSWSFNQTASKRVGQRTGFPARSRFGVVERVSGSDRALGSRGSRRGEHARCQRRLPRICRWSPGATSVVAYPASAQNIARACGAIGAWVRPARVATAIQRPSCPETAGRSSIELARRSNSAEVQHRRIVSSPEPAEGLRVAQQVRRADTADRPDRARASLRRCADPRRRRGSTALSAHSQPVSRGFRHGRWGRCTGIRDLPRQARHAPAAPMLAPRSRSCSSFVMFFDVCDAHPGDRRAHAHGSEGAARRADVGPGRGALEGRQLQPSVRATDAVLRRGNRAGGARRRVVGAGAGVDLRGHPRGAQLLAGALEPDHGAVRDFSVSGGVLVLSIRAALQVF